MSNIPKAREALHNLANSLDAANARLLRAIITGYLHRDPVIRRAPDKSVEITAAMRRQIFTLAKTDMHLSEIGHRLGINQGRVSEVLNGKR